MLSTRIVTAFLVLAALLLSIYALPDWGFALFVLVFVVLASIEWARLSGVSSVSGLILYAIVCGGLVLALGILNRQFDHDGNLSVLVMALASAFWCIAAPMLLWSGIAGVRKPVLGALGVILLAATGLAVISLYALDKALLLALMGLVWVADSAAYFVGRRFGRRKLAPRISPGKTVEGAAGALAATFLYAIICGLTLTFAAKAVSEAGWPLYLLLASIICCLSIMGDLFESLLKRVACVKDSGRILPGHGGVLDRIDSLTSTLPVATLLATVSLVRT